MEHLRDLQKPRRIIRLYHGSPVLNIQNFQISKSRESFLDFGKGIYFTTSEDQAMQWSIKDKKIGAVYMVEIDSALIKLKQYLTYSNEFIDTFCLCRAGLEEMVNNIKGYDAIYGYVIDNDKEGITRATNDYTLHKIEAAAVRQRIRIFDNKDQICFKNQAVLDTLQIKSMRLTERVAGYPQNDRRAVRWKK